MGHNVREQWGQNVSNWQFKSLLQLQRFIHNSISKTASRFATTNHHQINGSSGLLRPDQFQLFFLSGRRVCPPNCGWGCFLFYAPFCKNSSEWKSQQFLKIFKPTSLEANTTNIKKNFSLVYATFYAWRCFQIISWLVICVNWRTPRESKPIDHTVYYFIVMVT